MRPEVRGEPRRAAERQRASVAGQRERVPGRGPRARRVAGGAASSTTWALVPLNPNELTPAMRRARAGGQGRALVATSSGQALPRDVGVRASSK